VRRHRRCDRPREAPKSSSVALAVLRASSVPNASLPTVQPIRRRPCSPDCPAVGAVRDVLESEICYHDNVERNLVIATLKAHEAELKQLGVRQLYLFGSTARGEAGDNSDVDLFFDYEEGAFGLFDLMEVQEHASRILGRKADVMTRDSIHKVLRPRIEASAFRVF
jgi:predicted nucleotidyltransferase